MLRGAGRPRQIHNAVKNLLESKTYKETPGATRFAHPENVSNQLTQRGCDVNWACVHMLDTLGMSNDLPVRPSRCRFHSSFVFFAFSFVLFGREKVTYLFDFK